ncbi:MAG: TusE/DsrC/DsvC family sulfur relay protein [Peptococcaceae bacterium]
MVKISSDGYLLNPREWNEEVAESLACYENINLTERHWDVILFVRDYYLDFKVLPTVHKICAHTGLNTLEVYQLFPRGPVHGACRIAGASPELFIFK